MRFLPRLARATALWAIAAAVALTVAAHALLPKPWLRDLSGPPPWFAFDANFASGFFVSPDGYVVTARHVVPGCRRITVSGHGFRAAEATLVSYAEDPAIDLALLHVSVETPAALALSDLPWPSAKPPGAAEVGKEPEPGEFIGFPEGNHTANPTVEAVELQPSVNSTDHVHWSQVVFGLMAQGQSGSPALGRSGSVVGVVVRMSHEPRDTSTPHEGELVAAAYVRRILAAHGLVGVRVSSRVPQDAAVRVFCFETWPGRR